MGAYLWLIWYDASSKGGPKHWTLAVSYEANDRAYATIYEVGVCPVISQRLYSILLLQVNMDFTGLYESRVVRRVVLTGNHPTGPYAGKILLGEVNDNVLGSLEAYSDTAAELVNSLNRKRGQGSLSCHDWAAFIVRSLEDAMLLPKVCQISFKRFRMKLIDTAWVQGCAG